MNMLEYAPANIPTIIGSVNSLIDSTPKTYSAKTVNNVVSDVLIDRERVWLMLTLVISALDSFRPNLLLFSRILSKTTIVLFME